MSRASFDRIYRRAVERKGAPEALETELPTPASTRELERTGDDRYLAQMTRCVFNSGFVWRIVAAKWPGFEECFYDFDPERVVLMDESELADLMEDERIIRHWKKLSSVPENAAMVLDLSEEHGSFGRFIASWPEEEIVDLWWLLKTRGSRLGGSTGPMFLRHVGKDTFLPTHDVTERLRRLGVIEKGLTSKRDLAAAQAMFNRWAEESGRPLCQLSRILACS